MHMRGLAGVGVLDVRFSVIETHTEKCFHSSGFRYMGIGGALQAPRRILRRVMIFVRPLFHKPFLPAKDPLETSRGRL